MLDEIAWYADNSGNHRIESTKTAAIGAQNYVRQLADNGNQVQRVGLKKPNALDLYDMMGNVWQWTNDWYGEAYYGQQEGRDPQGPVGGDKRVLRGGSWISLPRFVRVSYRYRFGPSFRSSEIGLRCVGE